MAAPAAKTLAPARAAQGAAPSSGGGFRHGGRSVAASARTIDGAANSRVMKLVRKLQGLIHLAEEERRLDDARRQVRMAEDSAAARAEGQGSLGRGGSGNQRPIDIEALGREVTEIVSNEIANRRNRRMEDSDDFWW